MEKTVIVSRIVWDIIMHKKINSMVHKDITSEKLLKKNLLQKVKIVLIKC